MSKETLPPPPLPDQVPPAEPPPLAPGNEELDRAVADQISAHERHIQEAKKVARSHLKKSGEAVKKFEKRNEDLEYFLESGPDAQERYVLYSLLKKILEKIPEDERIEIPQTASLEELQTYFDPDGDIAEETGLAYDGEQWVQVPTIFFLSPLPEALRAFIYDALERENAMESYDEMYLSDLIKEDLLSPALTDIKYIRFARTQNERFEEKEQVVELPEREKIARGEEFYVLYRLLEDHGLRVDPLWDIYALRQQFKDFRGEKKFGFGFDEEENEWFSIDMNGENEYFHTSNFIEAYDKIEGLKHELVVDTSDAPEEIDTQIVANSISNSRKFYQEWKEEMKKIKSEKIA